jgi:hypothetical protein
MMFHNTVRSLLFLSFLLSGNAETVRGVHRELEAVFDLGDAGDYAILTQDAISTVPSSVITGDIGVYGAILAAITGFSLDDAHSTSLQIQAPGKAYASDTLLLNAVRNITDTYRDVKNRGPGVRFHNSHKRNRSEQVTFAESFGPRWRSKFRGGGESRTRIKCDSHADSSQINDPF